MPTIAEQIAMREPTSVDVPEPMPMTAAEIVRAANQKAAPTDPMEIAKLSLEVAGDPQKMQSILDGVGDEFDDHAPGVAFDARASTARMIHFLASKAPKESSPVPGLASIKPPQTEVRRFEQYLRAVNDPTVLLDDAMQGTLSLEAVEAVKTVYPQTFARMQSDLAERLQAAQGLPYKRRIQLSALLGQDMAGTLNPRLGMMAQSTYQQASGMPAPEQTVKPMKIGQGKALQGVAGREGAETTAWREAQRGARAGSGTR